jgi:hypothetical protein
MLNYNHITMDLTPFDNKTFCKYVRNNHELNVTYIECERFDEVKDVLDNKMSHIKYSDSQLAYLKREWDNDSK